MTAQEGSFRDTKEDKTAATVAMLEPKPLDHPVKPGTLRDGHISNPTNIGLIGKRGARRRYCQAAERMGRTNSAAFETLGQRDRRERITDGKPGKAVDLGERAEDEDIEALTQESDRALP